MIPIIDGILGVVKTAGGIFSNWQKRKLIKSQGKIEIEKAKVEGEIKREQTRVEGDVQYDNIVAEGMKFSWKDEWFTILLSAPFIGSFIPGVQVYVRDGFVFLHNHTPDWYQWAFLGAIIASFGLKDLFKDWMKSRMQ
jgi:hypothetical protein